MKYGLGSKIRKYREEQGLNQKQLAQLIGVSNSRISNWEQGLNRPDADILAQICRVLKVSPSQLLDVNLAPDELDEQERRVIQAYRKRPELHSAIHILLGIQE